MSVTTELGLDPNLEGKISQAWPAWTRRRPELAVVTDPSRLRGWLRGADPQQADRVVYGLAWLASVEGGDDHDAAQALAWLLIPGASFLALKLESLSDDIDQVIAGHAWELVRTFPLGRRKVIRNLMWDLRSEVLAACEAPSTLRRRDRTWYSTSITVDDEAIAALPLVEEPSALEELEDVLDWACEHDVIASADRQLLLMLVEASQCGSLRRIADHGLLGNEATAEVAALLGVCERTVRRRARKSLHALKAAAPAYTRVA